MASKHTISPCLSICSYCDRPIGECSLMMRSIPPQGAKWTIKAIIPRSKLKSRNGKSFVYIVKSCPYFVPDPKQVEKEQEEKARAKAKVEVQMTNSREKGARGERELANVLKAYGYAAQRGQQFAGSPDSPDVKGLPFIHIECKRVERLDLYAAMKQSVNDSGEDELPAVFHRRNNKEWLVTMRLDDWMKLYKGAEE